MDKKYKMRMIYFPKVKIYDIIVYIKNKILKNAWKRNKNTWNK